ncbi:LysR substrate-binding domain-containing protein, partial [Haliangium sp. UPWRP_2]|uniref:LysR substrate-binding domain-containing protein n=1 Tax=Haliangium sp. UPWRP_2 TaxID=1931276 RepID=UPI001E2AAC04
QLLSHLMKEAPRLDLEVRGGPAELESALEEGRIDVALGVFPKLSPRIRQQRLFDDGFVCLLRKGHPAARRRLTTRQFAALSHVQIAPRGAPGGPVDDALAQHGLQRRVALRIGSFLSALQLVARTDLVLTAPERLVRTLLGALPLRVLEPPLALPRFSMYQVWHESRQQDPAHAWLRGVLAELSRQIQI